MNRLDEVKENIQTQEAFDRIIRLKQDQIYNNPYRCETCKWYRYSEVDDEWVCINRHSDYCAEQMGDYDTCDNWEGKQRVG